MGAQMAKGGPCHEKADFFEATVEKSKSECIQWLHDSLVEWQLLLENVSYIKNDERNGLVAKILELVATKIVSPVMEGNGIQEKQVRILTVTCNNKFIDSIKATVVSWSAQPKKHEILGELLAHLHVFCEEVLERIQFLGADVLLNLVCAAIGAAASSTVITRGKPELLGQFTTLQQKIQEINKSLEEKNKPKKKLECFDDMEQLLHSIDPPEDFREIPVVPTLEELICEHKPFLRPNKVIGSYRSSEHYLDVHFRLLREDFVRPLRYAVQEFMKNRNEYIQNIGTRKANRERDSSVRVYTDVTFLRSEETIAYGTSTENYLFGLPKRFVTKVNWDKSKRLLPGCLVMLTADYGKTALFAITQQPPFDPKKRKERGGGDFRRQELARGILRLSIETGQDLVQQSWPYLMFECEAFFEAYRHNLAILQTLTCLEDDGIQPNCLNKVIVHASPELGPPAYLTKGSSIQFPIPCKKLEISKIKELVIPPVLEPKILSVSPFHPETWPAEEIQEKMNVDPDQYEALKTALSSELAVIQGPPGTGKTYIGLQIVKTLLHNKEQGVLPQSPFLVVCYTNHALDQFLELLLAALPSLSMVRVGGQSKSEVLQNYMLPQHRRNAYYESDNEAVSQQKQRESDASRNVKALEHLLADLKLEVAALSNPDGIFNFHKMRVGDRLQRILPYGLWRTMAKCEWLGFWPENFLVPDFQVKEIVLQLFVVKRIMPGREPSNRHWGRPAETEVTPVGAQNAVENMAAGSQKQEDSEYNMDELLEHRLVDNDDWESAYAHDNVRRDHAEMTSLYLNKCSTQGCRSMMYNILKQWASAQQQYISVETDDSHSSYQEYMWSLNKACDKLLVLSRERVDYENRTNLLSTIFGLYNEGRLALPSVDRIFREAWGGRGYMITNQKVIQYPIRLKWAIYFKVVEIARDMAIAYRDEVAVELVKARKNFAEERNKLDGYILKSADIIGMTTTGAAKNHGLLKIARPSVLIVEEAAEILEAHIVTSLTEDCKHLILIGDHQQLRPSANIFELEVKYRLNVSLFERMILNGIPLCTLKTQHRMRPEISNLIIGPIYDELHNHPKVHKYPHVKGVTKSLFFINHHELEQSDSDLLSKSNYHEADFVVGLCEYLLKQGYEHKQITILTTYTGQLFLLRKIFPESCQGVRVTCVDNFQGEENDIILLSLVRSNDKDKVGFVAIDNRICVALSRARHGLYVIGNMDGMVVASKTWKKIQRKLKEGGNIGDKLKLVCEQHGNKTDVKFGNDFRPLASGGCQKKCEAKLQCSHFCPQLCHALDQSHEDFRCMQRCIKKCDSGHQCSARCSKECPPCKYLVLKLLPCGHEGKVPCFQDVTTVSCRVRVLRILECELDHELEMECHVDVQIVKCKTPVEKILPCGHVCMVDCHMSPGQVKCEVENEKLLKCGHSRLLKCYQSVDTVDCDIPVKKILLCGHPCILKCSQPIIESIKAKCTKKCENALPCGHPCPKDCHVQDDPDHQLFVCKEKCVRSCDSGHPCKWGHPCFKKCLPCDVSVSLTLACGHEVTSECSKANGVINCLKKMKKILSCEHEQWVACHVEPEKHKCTFQIVQCDKKCSSGHSCSFDHACYEGCPPCEERVEKTLQSCHHVADLPCHDNGSDHECKTSVVKKLACAHSQKAPCYIDSSLIACKEKVQMTCKKCTSDVVVECRKKKEQLCGECEITATQLKSNNDSPVKVTGFRGRGRGTIAWRGGRGRGGRFTKFTYVGSAGTNIKRK